MEQCWCVHCNRVFKYRELRGSCFVCNPKAYSMDDVAALDLEAGDLEVGEILILNDDTEVEIVSIDDKVRVKKV